LAALAEAGGSFDWLAEEPDLYSDADGEPVSPDDSELHAGSTTSQPTSEIGVTGGAQLLDPGRPQRKNGDL